MQRVVDPIIASAEASIHDNITAVGNSKSTLERFFRRARNAQLHFSCIVKTAVRKPFSMLSGIMPYITLSVRFAIDWSIFNDCTLV